MHSLCLLARHYSTGTPLRKVAEGSLQEGAEIRENGDTGIRGYAETELGVRKSKKLIECKCFGAVEHTLRCIYIVRIYLVCYDYLRNLTTVVWKEKFLCDQLVGPK